jgi:hypothetical protein
MGPREQQLRDMREARADKAARAGREMRTAQAKKLIDQTITKPNKPARKPVKQRRTGGRGR